MKNKRTLASLATAVAVGTCGCAQAQANTLLSGYGGPGDGSQAILGSTLLNSPGGRSGSGGGSSGAQASASASVPQPARSGSGGRPAGRDTGASRGSRGRGGAGAPAGAGSTRSRRARGGGAQPDSVSPLARDAASVHTPALGITSSELALLIGVAAGLAAMWAATRRMARHGDG